VIVKHIADATRVLGAPPGWDGRDMTCGAFPVRDVITPEGQFMVSAWEPTPEELERMQRGETVRLWIHGAGHPVVALTVGDIV